MLWLINSAPVSVMHQWVREFHAWWPPFRVCILHESGSFRGSKANLIRSVATSSGILVTSYNGVSAFKELLHSAMFDHVILDEGHKIRNPDAQITVAVKMFPTAHRIILSGLTVVCPLCPDVLQIRSQNSSSPSENLQICPRQGPRCRTT